MTTTQDLIATYDPNIVWARHSFELTFMQWDYSLKVEVDVCGNCKGASLFRTALSTAFEDLYDDAEANAQIILKRPAEDGYGEDTLEIDLEDEDELQAICVAIRIIGHEKESP